jgi:hypothetical protein
MNAYGLAPLLLLFPALGVLFNAFFGRRFVDADRRIGERWSGWAASLMAISAFVVAVLLCSPCKQIILRPWSCRLRIGL